MTMDYGLTPAEQAAQRATQRADDTRRRRTVRTYQGMTGTDPGDFGGTPNNTKGAPFIPSPQMTRSPIIPPVRTAPMTGPTIRSGTDIGVDTSPWWSGGAFEPNSTGIPWDFGPSPYYPMRQVVEGF